MSEEVSDPGWGTVRTTVRGTSSTAKFARDMRSPDLSTIANTTCVHYARLLSGEGEKNWGRCDGGNKRIDSAV